LEKRAEQVLPGSEGTGGRDIPNMYTQVNKCINNLKMYPSTKYIKINLK
jgi:hypothetical protein